MYIASHLFILILHPENLEKTSRVLKRFTKLSNLPSKKQIVLSANKLTFFSEPNSDTFLSLCYFLLKWLEVQQQVKKKKKVMAKWDSPEKFL